MWNYLFYSYVWFCNEFKSDWEKSKKLGAWLTMKHNNGEQQKVCKGTTKEQELIQNEVKRDKRSTWNVVTNEKFVYKIGSLVSQRTTEKNPQNLF